MKTKTVRTPTGAKPKTINKKRPRRENGNSAKAKTDINRKRSFSKDGARREKGSGNDFL